MKNFKSTLLLCAVALFAGGDAFAVPTAAAIDELNRFMGPVAYKYQMGTLIEEAATVVTGDITDGTILAADFAEDAVDTDAILDGTILNEDVDAAAAIAFTKLAALASTKVLVGNGSNVAVAVALSGDVTMANTGAVSIASGVISESMIESANSNSLHIARIARANFVCTTNCNVDQGITSAQNVSLPAKAVIIRSYFRINTQFVDGGSGTIALSCEDANNIKTATDISGSGVGVFIEGQSTGAASAFIASIASTCVLTLTSSGAEPSAGALTLWVHYVVADT